ncbi:MAG: head GIN domain-containing protein [Marinilabiliaceae bacterium]
MAFKHFNIIPAFAAALASAVLFSSCILEKRHTADGELRDGLITVSQPISEFSEIEASGAMVIAYRQAPTDSIRIEGAANLVSRVIVDQEGERLKLRMKEGRVSMSDAGPKLVVYLSSENLSSVRLSGANKLKMSEPVSVDELRLGVAGAGDVDIDDLTVKDRLRIDLSGAGDLDIDNATANRVDIRMSGAGNIDANFKNASAVNVDVSGAGDADLKLTDCGDIRCDVSGAANVDLAGSAQRLDFSKSGAADVDYDKLSLAECARVR